MTRTFAAGAATGKRRFSLAGPGPVSLAIFFLAACGERAVVGTPPVSEDDLLKVSDVIVAAQCDLNEAVRLEGASIGYTSAVLTLTMTTVVTEATGGGLTLAIPVAGSRISLERARRPIGSAVRRMEVQLLHEIGAEIDCPSEERPKTDSGVRYIEGGLGLRQWVEETERVGQRAATVPSVVNYSLGFDIALTSSFNPIFSRRSDAGVSPDLSPENADARRVAHRLSVTMLPDQEGFTPPRDAQLAAAQSYLERLAPN